MKLKVCGMKHNPLELLPLEPDDLGFIFWEPSSRYVGGRIPQIPETVKKVGVFVYTPLGEVLEKTGKHRLQALQLHGKESPGYCRELRTAVKALPDRTPEIIKAFSIGENFDFSILEGYMEPCDLFLFDSKGKLPGGNGHGFDWSLLMDYPFDKPFLLSGGIGPESVAPLRDFLKSPASKYCIGLDVNSRFEREPGLKDVELLKKFKALLYHGPSTQNHRK